MRIECHSVVGFLNNLKNFEDGTIFRNRIYVEKTEIIESGNQRTAVYKKDIMLYISALMVFNDDRGEALLECGLFCGIDDLTSGGELEGSSKRENYIQAVDDFCSECTFEWDGKVSHPKICEGVLRP